LIINLTTGSATAQTNLSPSTSLYGLAYTNSIAGATTSTLYGYDYGNDRLVVLGGGAGIPSPNTGQLFTIGSSGIVTENGDSLDIVISGATGIGYAVM
jgi:Domain of unknown function (DUF4394)